MSFIKKLNNFVAWIESALLVFIVLIMVVFSFFQVFMRNLFDQGILWGDTFLRQMVLWVGFIGASLATKEKKHINIDVFGRITKGIAKDIIEVLTQLFAGMICVVLTYASWNFVQQERMFETILFNDIPAWYFQLIIPIGFLLMALRFIINGIDILLHSGTNKGKSA
jgi:TRAP-type C4-dicarboxylate transport system permease small subunit